MAGKKTQIQGPAGWAVITNWLAAKGLKAFPFQEEAWQMYLEGQSGIINAPTGFGKTFAGFLGVLIDWISRHPDDYQTRAKNGLQLLWISPLRALALDIARAMETVFAELGMPWQVAVRNGDTPVSERQKQKKHLPEVLIITPESLHLIFASKGYEPLLRQLACIVVDEWHELIGTKRGVQTELAIAHLKSLRQDHAGAAPLRIWGISATIGNLDEALEVLLGPGQDGVVVRSGLQKRIAIRTILPDSVERFPWSGHLGINMIEHVLPVIRQSRSTILFINVRSQAEMWYQALLAAAPDLAGLMALHHSAIDARLRVWVEEQLHAGGLQVVVSTSSLDLGVDFRPVDTIIQVGSPKGVARFMQRAGRSGHAPHEVSNIYFVPTHSLEIMEAVALEQAYEAGLVESRQPVILAYDVLIQYMVTRAVGAGFEPEALYREVCGTYAFSQLAPEQWAWLLLFITRGGSTLEGYEEYHKVVFEDGRYKVTSRKVAMRHRLHMGTIVGDNLMRVKFVGGGFIGTIEEHFISRLRPGDAFILAGRRLELVRVKDMEAQVRRSTAKNALVPAWQGGRLPLSADLGRVLRHVFHMAATAPGSHPLLSFLSPLLETQRRRSYIPAEDELLMELIHTRDGYHLFVYPFEGRLVHQALASLLAYRLSQLVPITFSIAMNDYGFELLSDQPIPLDEEVVYELLRTDQWYAHMQESINATELGRRKFREIAVIAGLIFQGYPGAYKRQRHLQSSSSLIYDVLQEHEPANLLLQQAHHEVLTYEVEAGRLYEALKRMYHSKVVITRPQRLTPFCFPIKVDSLRAELSSEQLQDRIRKMKAQLEAE